MPFMSSTMERMSHTGTATSPNYSILAIPAYYALSLLPHSYAVWLATGGQPSKWDNRNPRAAGLKSALQDSLSAEEYARYERAEAAHANLLESVPVFATAVILGNMAGFRREGWGGLNGFAAAYVGVRALYALVFVNTTTNRMSSVRSLLWAASVGLCMNVIVKAANALGDVAKLENVTGGAAFRME